MHGLRARVDDEKWMMLEMQFDYGNGNAVVLRFLIRISVLAVHRPDICLIFFERVEVNHPVEDDGMKCSSGRVARILGGDGSVKTEERMGSQGLPLFAPRRGAEIHMLVPLRDAQRNSLVEFVFGKALRRGVHDADEFVIVAMLFIKKRGGMLGVEGGSGFPPVSIIGEVIHPLLDVEI